MDYQYNCVNCGSKLKELEYVIEHEKQITCNTFKKNIGNENYKNLEFDLGYGDCPTTLRLNTDWHVSFHKSKLPDNRQVYYCCHSCIEYIYY